MKLPQVRFQVIPRAVRDRRVGRWIEVVDHFGDFDIPVAARFETQQRMVDAAESRRGDQYDRQPTLGDVIDRIVQPFQRNE